MPVRQYLDHTVVPVVLQALTELAKERYQFIYIQDHKIRLSLLRNI